MNAWLLQTNATYLDVDAYLTLNPCPTVWGTPRYADRMQVGDPVFLWRARGRTKLEPGIVAFGEVVQEPSVREHTHPDLCAHPRMLRAKWRVGLRLAEVRLTPTAGMIPRAEVKRMPEMMRHPIVTANTGSDFALSGEQYAALRDAWSFTEEGVK